MKKLLLATAAVFFPGLAWAQCTPTTAPPQSFGCAPQLAPQLTDYAVIWRPTLAPNGNIMISTLTQLQSLIGGGGGGGGGGPFLPLSGGTLTGLLTASAGIKTGDNINITLSSDGLAQLGYAATAGAVQLQNKPFQPLMGLQLLDNTPIVMSTDGTAIFSYDPNVGVYRFQGRPVEIDSGLTIPGGGALAAGSVAASNGIVSGNPTGGNMGPGTINVATGGYYADGEAFNPSSVPTGPTNAIPYYASSGSTLTPLATAINSVLGTDGSGLPSFNTTLPANLTIPTPTITGTLTLGSADVLGTLSVGGTANIASALTALIVNAATLNASGGAIDNTVIGGTTPAAGKFSTVTVSGGTINSTTVGATTPAAGTFSTITASGGAINNTVIGGTTPAVGTFSSLTSHGTITIDGNSAIAVGSPTTPLYLSFINNTPYELLRVGGVDGGGSYTPILDINGALASNTVLHNELALSSGANAPTNHVLLSIQSIAGAASSGYAPYLFQVTDTMTGSQSGIFTTNDYVQTGATGGRIALSSQLQLQGTTGNNTGVGGAYVGATFSAFSNVNDNGNSTGFGTSGAGKGEMWALNTVSKLGSSGTYYNQLEGYELDMEADPGSSANIKIGLAIVDLGSSGTGSTQGAWIDAALVIGNAFTQQAGSGWQYGIQFSNPEGYFPIASTGTMIGAAVSSSGTELATNGIDFHLVTFSGNFLNSNGFTVDGSGNTVLANETVNGDVHFETTGVHLFFATIASGANHLPTCNGTTNGSITIVIDWSAPTFLKTVTADGGGGSVHAPALCNGTDWVAF